MSSRTGSRVAPGFPRRAFGLVLAALVCAPLVPPAAAQSMRDPTAAEKAVLMRVYDAVDAFVTTFLAAHDMVLDTGASRLAAGLSVPVHGPIATAFEWDATVKRDSERDRAHVQPAIERITALTQAGRFDEVKAARREMERWTRLSITVELNAQALGLGSAPARNAPLVVAGAAKAFVVAEDDEAPDHRGARMIAFGRWQDARHDAADGADRFHFVRPAQTAHVENVVVTLSGADDLVRALLAAPDWTRIAATLTP